MYSFYHLFYRHTHELEPVIYAKSHVGSRFCLPEIVFTPLVERTRVEVFVKYVIEKQVEANFFFLVAKSAVNPEIIWEIFYDSTIIHIPRQAVALELVPCRNPEATQQNTKESSSAVISS